MCWYFCFLEAAVIIHAGCLRFCHGCLERSCRLAQNGLRNERPEQLIEIALSTLLVRLLDLDYQRPASIINAWLQNRSKKNIWLKMHGNKETS